MSSFYSVGLQNVGSYQVSGRPWCKHFSTTAGEIQYVSFPKVTKSLWAHFEKNSSSHEVHLAFCEPKRAIDFTGTAEYLTSTFPQTDQLTASVWVKVAGLTANLLFLEIGGGNTIRIVSDGSSNIRFRVEGTNTTPPHLSFLNYDWINLTIVINGTSNKIYVNGEMYKANAGDAGTGLNSISIGGGGVAGYDGTYDELALFSTALSDAEVSELYNAGKTLKTTSHSRASDLVSRWDFEDNNYKNFYSTPDTATLIYDRVSGNNLSLTGGTPTPLTFVNGRLMENAFASHKVTLTDHQEIHLPFKTKGLVWHSTHADDFSLFASLTGIPASRMYELTGPGIDE